MSVPAPAPPVLLDASQLSGQSAHSGIGSYVRGLLGGLGALPGVTVEAMATDEATLPPGVRRVSVRRRFRTGRPAVWEHETRRVWELRRHRSGVFHNPNPHAPIAPLRPWVQTLYDVIPLHSSDPIDAAFRKRFERFGPRYARADAVIAISRHAADEGMRLLGIAPSIIEVIHLGVGPEYSPGPADHEGTPYLLVVCEYSRRKNLDAAVAVIDALADAGRPHRLRIAGRVPPWVADEFARTIAGARHPERIDVLGFVDDLVSLYRGADVVLVTSRSEGFGLPAAEAMACGAPVVSFDNTSLREVIADGGILIPDGSVAAMVGAVRRLVGSPAARRELAERAEQRSHAFNWFRAATQTVEVYRRVDGQ